MFFNFFVGVPSNKKKPKISTLFAVGGIYFDSCTILKSQNLFSQQSEFICIIC